MPSEKRQRQDEGRLVRLEEQRVATQKTQRKGQLRTLAMIVGGVLVVAGGFAIFTGDKPTAVDSTGTTGTGSTDTTVVSPVILPGAGASITGETPCPAVDGSAERTTSFENPPPMCIDPTKSYTATLATTEGDLVVELDAETAPQTVNNFVVLARYHFYDDVPFHRIVYRFVNQAGDPVGPEPGAGGPGYVIPDELPADPATAYPSGAVAMANRGPNSGGSQFFIVVDDAEGALTGTGSYSVFGQVTPAGIEVSEAINALVGPNDLPTKPVTITKVTITES